jgi:hypothetical protein
MADKEILIQVVADEESDLVALGEEVGLRQAGGDQVEDLVIDPLTAAVLIGAALAVGRFIMRVINERRGGVRVELTVSPAKISRNREIPFGFVYIFSKDGKVDIKVNDEPKDSVERIIAAVLALPITATVDMVKAKIEEAKKTTPADATPAPPAGG